MDDIIVIQEATNEFELEITQIDTNIYSLDIVIIVGAGTSLTAQTLGDTIFGATEKTTPADTDMVALMDSEDLVNINIAKKFSWSSIKTALTAVFNSLYATINHTHANDHAPHSDDQDLSSKVDKVTGSSLVPDTEIAKIHAAGSDNQDLSGLVDKITNYSLVADTEIAKIHASGSDNQDLSGLVEKVTGSSLVADTEIAKIHSSGSDAESNATVGALINGGTNITTPDDTDEVAIKNHTGGALAKVTWANIKVALNLIYSPILTFSNGLTRTVNDIKNNLITGLAGGQTVIGGTAASENLNLSSTTNVTKGKVISEDNFQITPLASATEKILTTGTTNANGLVEGSLQTDSAFITNTTLQTALLLETNWTPSYTGTTIGAVEGQKYVGINYLYLFQNSIFTRYLISLDTFTNITLAAGVTTFVIISNAIKITGDAGANTIATITGGYNGQRLVLFFIDALVTITDTAAATANTINLSAAFVSAANTTLSLIYDGNKWFETGRSVN